MVTVKTQSNRQKWADSRIFGIGSKTKTGLKVKALLDTKEYKTGIEISDAEMATINMEQHKTHPVWNYTISPGRKMP